MATPLNLPAGGEKREAQVAVVPLDQIQVEDVGLGAANVDAWLQEISGGIVTLERIKAVAGGLPVVGNIMALVDALNDIARLWSSEKRDPWDWVSLAINLIGVLPRPPGMAAARMSLRPMLFLVRQEIRRTGKLVLSDVLIEILIGHLNATIVGTLDDFVPQAQAKLPGILDDAGKLGEEVLLQIAAGLEKLVDPKLNANADLLEAEQLVHGAGDLWAYDHQAAIRNIFAAAAEVCSAAGKGAVNGAAEYFVPEALKEQVLRHAGSLRAMGPELRDQINRLADPGLQNSIGALLETLAGAVVTWRSRNGHGQSFNIKPGVTNQAKRRASEGKLEAVEFEKPAKGLPNDLKDCACAHTIGSISFAMGSESVSHTDFILPGPFPIEWTRTYCSSLDAYDQDVIGARWITPFTTRFDLVGDGLVFHDADGRSHEFPLPKVKLFHFNAIENLTVVRLSKDRLLLMRGLEHRETYVRRGKRFVLINKVLPNGAGVMLHHEHLHGDQMVLSELVTYSEKDLNKVHLRLGTLIDDQGRSTGFWEVRDGDVKRQLCAYQYDEFGDLVLAQDENGSAWRYQYQDHLITRYTDRTNRGLNLQWQGTGPDARAVREWADDGSFDTRLAWDENIRLTYVTDALGHETRHYYDSLGYTYRICHADGRSEWFFRDAAKNIIRHVHTDGSTDRYRYDKLSNLTEHTRADHSVINYAYDDKSHLIKISDGEGGLWKRDYDFRGNLVEAIDPLENVTEYTYNKFGLPTAITDANGNTKNLEYNAAGQLLKYVDCSGKTSSWEYDERGQMVRFTDPAGHSITYEYKLGQLVLIKHPDKTEERFSRDAEGRLLAYSDGLERCTTWRYTAAGFVAERVDAAEQTLRYRWDKLGRLIALENENERRAHFHYDPVGRLLEERGFDNRSTRYQYDPETGRLAETIYGQRTIALTFDPMGRLTERRAILGEKSQSETFAYDGNGHLLMATNATSKLQWFHDAAGNLLREHQHYTSLIEPLVAVWQHEYDALNNRVATVRPDGHRVSWLTYGSGHLLGLKLDEHELISYERDDLHREVARHQGNELLQTQSWDPAGRLNEQLLGRTDKSVLIKRAYTYDAAGQLTDINDSRRGPLSYRYDPVSRLINATSRLALETFAFDPASNLLNETAAPARRPLDPEPVRHKLVDNLLRDYAGGHYEYDEHGNLTERWTNGLRSELHWDLFDRLVHFYDPRLTVDFGYDPLGRRLYKFSKAHYRPRPEAGTGWNENEHARKERELGCGFTLYGWDGDNLAWESSPPPYAGALGRTVHYIHEPDTFVPVAQAIRHETIRLVSQPKYEGRYNFKEDPLWTYKPVALPIDALAWYQCDHLGTPQEITDQNGNTAWSAQYKAWGEATEQRSEFAQQIGLTNPIRFQGQYHDHETGLHYNRHRYYDPRVGRFISKDPIGYLGGLNVYQYGPNSISWVDPLGLASSAVGPGRKPKSDKPNQNCKRACRKKWEVNRYDRVCEGNVPGVGYARYYKDPDTKRWWSADKTGHGDSAWKVYEKGGAWIADVDIYGDHMDKHKSETGKQINFKSLKCWNNK